MAKWLKKWLKKAKINPRFKNHPENYIKYVFDREYINRMDLLIISMGD